MEYFSNRDSLNVLDFAFWTQTAIPKYWHRKEFKDFKYISPELTTTQLNWIFVIILLFNIGFSVYIVLNNFNSKTNNYY
jgi:hypothetical protein